MHPVDGLFLFDSCLAVVRVHLPNDVALLAAVFPAAPGASFVLIVVSVVPRRARERAYRPDGHVAKLASLLVEELPEVDAAAAMRAAGAPEMGKGGPQLFSKEFFEAQMEVVIEEKVPVYAAGLGNPEPWMDRLHANGTKVMAVIGKVKHAEQVVGSGIDMIVAQGHDGGGHNSPIGTISLIPQVVDAVGDRVPVLGAGGISDGRGVAAAMMLGAEGAWVGTAFLATEEAGIERFQKEAITESGDADTVVSRSLTGKPARMIRNKWADAWVQAGKEPLPMPYQSMISGPVMASGIKAERKDVIPGFAGQGIGLIDSIRPAAEVMRDLVDGAEKALASAGIYK